MLMMPWSTPCAGNKYGKCTNALEFCRAHGFRISSKTKYSISSYDPRWLPGEDGQKIFPLPPDTEFRYLGAFLSLNLTSKKQIQIINNTIMNWRWRAIAQKIDPAMLASTVTEYLLPKICIWNNRGNVQRMDKNHHTHTRPHRKYKQNNSPKHKQRSLLSSCKHPWCRPTHANPTNHGIFPSHKLKQLPKW